MTATLPVSDSAEEPVRVTVKTSSSYAPDRSRSEKKPSEASVPLMLFEDVICAFAELSEYTEDMEARALSAPAVVSTAFILKTVNVSTAATSSVKIIWVMRFILRLILRFMLKASVLFGFMLQLYHPGAKESPKSDSRKYAEYTKRTLSVPNQRSFDLVMQCR